MLTMTACSSDQNDGDVDYSTRATGDFTIKFAFEDAGNVSRASSFIPTTSWDNIKQIQFFLYDAGNNDVVAFSAIATPSGSNTEASKMFPYTNIPEGAYTLVAVANTKSNSDNVTTYTNGTAVTWTDGNVFGNDIKTLLVKHKAGSWGAAITGSTAASTAVAGLNPFMEPSEVFTGYASVTITKNTTNYATVELKREVSMMRVRIDQATYVPPKNVDFTDAKASILLYRLPDHIGLKSGDNGGVVSSSTPANVLSVPGAFSTTTAGYLEGNYSSWKDVIVYPNNKLRSTDTATGADAADDRRYFVVVCGIAKAGHYYAGSTTETPVGDPVFWSGPIDKVFTPNTIREVNLILKTGGKPTPPDEIIEYGDLEVTVNKPLDWGAIVITDPMEL